MLTYITVLYCTLFLIVVYIIVFDIIRETVYILCVINLALMEFGALFIRVGIILCLKLFFANV